MLFLREMSLEVQRTQELSKVTTKSCFPVMQNSTWLKNSHEEKVTATLHNISCKISNVTLGFPLLSRSVFVSVTLSALEINRPRLRLLWLSI